MPTVRTLAVAFCALVLVACTTAATWAAGGRAALVLGNAAYPDSDAALPTALADARALGDELKRRGFTVFGAENASKDATQAAVDKFLRGIEPDGIALVFFSGYGIQAGKKNYLIPVDARIWSEADVARDGLSVDNLVDEMGKRRAAIRVVVLDASRRNPFERRFRSFSQGLAAATGQSGSLTLYATAAGGVVNEGGSGGGKSPFVTELIQQIGGDQTADQAFAATRDALARRTRNGQVPALSANLDETFSFDPDRPRTSVKSASGGGDRDRRDREDVDRRDREARDRDQRDRDARDREARDRETRDREARDRDNRDREARDRDAREQEARDRDRKARDREAALTAERSTVDAFNAARAKGTREAYQDFLDRHASGPYADRARAELGRLDTDEKQAGADFDDADAKGTVQAYRDFLERHPKGPLADKARAAEARAAGAERRRADQERQRLAELDDRIRRNPKDEAAHYERGQFYAQRGDASAAIADFDQAIRLNPGSPEAYNNRCWMRAMADDLKKALTDCNEALKLRPAFLDALDSRGLVNLKSGLLQAAITDYGEALKLDPHHSSALYGRGLARKRLGQDAPAGRDMASALEINPQIDKEFASYGLR